MGKFSKPSSSTVKPDEILGMQRIEQRMNNPNTSNYYGSSNTTFDANDQANVTQSFSPEMQGLVDMQMARMQQGPNEFKQSTGGYNRGMMDNFSSNLGNRSGFQVPTRELPSSFQQGSPAPMGELPTSPVPQSPMPPAGGMPPPQNGSPPPVGAPQPIGQPIGNPWMDAPKAPDALARALMGLGGQ